MALGGLGCRARTPGDAEVAVRIETVCTIHLDEREIRLAETHGGLPVILPTATDSIVVRVERNGNKEEET